MTGGQQPHPGQVDVPEAAVDAAFDHVYDTDMPRGGWAYRALRDAVRDGLRAAAPHMSGYVVGAHDVVGKVVLVRMPAHIVQDFQEQATAAVERLRTQAGAALAIVTAGGGEVDLTVLDEAEMARHGWVRAREEEPRG